MNEFLFLLAGLSIGMLVVQLVDDIAAARARRKARKTEHCSRCRAYTREHYGDDPQRPPKGPGSGARAGKP